jgi:hypothetical protein
VLVVSGNGTLEIFHAAVVEFDGVMVKNLVNGICFWKVLIN